LPSLLNLSFFTCFTSSFCFAENATFFITFDAQPSVQLTSPPAQPGCFIICGRCNCRKLLLSTTTKNINYNMKISINMFIYDGCKLFSYTYYKTTPGLY
jgi:hypothetical protein